MRYLSFVNKMAWVGILFCLFSCANRNEETYAFREVNVSLERSNEEIDKQVKTILASLNGKLSDPLTHTDAKAVMPSVELACQYANSAVSFIDSLKTEIKKEADEEYAGRRFNELQRVDLLRKVTSRYVDSLVSLDSFMVARLFLQKMLPEYLSFEKKQIQNLSSATLVSLMSSLQNTIKLAQKEVVYQYFQRAGPMASCDYGRYRFTMLLNNTYVKTNENMLVTAGMIDHAMPYKPVIRINGKVVKRDPDQPEIYKFKAPTKPGKYQLTVEVTYMQPDSTPATLIKEIPYTVAEN